MTHLRGSGKGLRLGLREILEILISFYQFLSKVDQKMSLFGVTKMITFLLIFENFSFFQFCSVLKKSDSYPQILHQG